jgi:hypothetical protein
MSDIEIRENNVKLGAGEVEAYANVINFKSPLTATVNTTSGVANVGANTSRITDLPAISDAIGNDVLVVVTNATSIPVTEKISIADFFGNVQANALFAANATFIANVYVTNSSAIIIGNSTVNVVHSTDYISVSSATEIANIEPGVFKTGQTSANSTLIRVGVNSVINSSSLYVGNSSVNSVVNSETISVSGSTVSVKVNQNSVDIGNAIINLVANSTSLKITNSTANITIVSPNTTHISNGSYFLNANGSWTIVSGASAVAGGANTNIQYNDSGSISGSNAFNFNSSSNTVTVSNTVVIGNSTVNVTSNSSTLKLSNSTSNVTVDVGAISIGNSTVNNKISVSLVSVSNSTGISNIQPGSITVGSASVNTSGISVGSNAVVNLTTFSIQGSATVGNGVVNSSTVYVGNSLTSTIISKDMIDLGSTTSNLVINASSVKISNSTVNLEIVLPTSTQILGTNYFLSANGDWAEVVPVAAIGGDNNQVQFSVSGALGGSNGFTFDTTTNTISLGNSSVVATVNSTTVKVGNSSVYSTVNTTAFNIVNSSANITITAANTTQANGKFFLNGNGNWVDINTSGLIAPTDPVPKGANTQIQFNDSGSLNAISAFTFSKSTNNVIVANNLTATSLHANSGYVLVGNSTVNTYINSTAVILSNSSSNTRIIIPTAAQYANTTTFLHANGSWISIANVFVGGAEGTTGTLQFAAADGTQSGNSNIRIIGNNSIVLANSSSNTRIAIPTLSERGDRHRVLHANGQWSHIRRVLRIRDDEWFFGRSPQSFFNSNWRFLSNNTVQFPDDTPTADWQTLVSGTVKVGGDSDGEEGSAYSLLCESSCKAFGARFFNFPQLGFQTFFDSLYWLWNDVDVDILFRFNLNNGAIVSEPIEIPFFTVRQRNHLDSGTLSKVFTNIGEGNYSVRFQAKLAKPNEDPVVAIKGRRLKVTQ